MSSISQGIKRKLDTTDVLEEQSLSRSSAQPNEQINDPSIGPSSNQSNNQSSDQSTNQTVSQSINQTQTASRSMIDELPGPLFAYVCRYLSIKEKCFLLTTLSHSVKQSIDRSIRTFCSSADQSTNCFASDTLTVDAADPYNELEEKLKYRQSVLSVDIKMDRSIDIDEDAFELLVGSTSTLFFDYFAYQDQPDDPPVGLNPSVARSLFITEKIKQSQSGFFVSHLCSAIESARDECGHPVVNSSSDHSNDESSSQLTNQIDQSDHQPADHLDDESINQSTDQVASQSADIHNKHYPVQLSRLEHLKITMEMAQPIDLGGFYRLSNIHQLLIHTSLLSITLDTPVCSFARDQYIQFIDALPASLTSITMSQSFAGLENWPRHHWINKFMNHTFLRNIRHLMLGESSRFTESLDTGTWLATSINQSDIQTVSSQLDHVAERSTSQSSAQSNQFRPWETLTLSIVDNSLLTVSLASLRTLTLHVTSHGFDLFRLLDASSMPVLENVTVSSGLSRTTPIDLEPLLEFLALRPMKSLMIELSPTEYEQWRPLSDHAVSLISRMCALQELVITMPMARFYAHSVGLASNDLSAVIAPNCWPHLSLLRICNMTINVSQFGPFVRGAPALTDVMLGGFQQHPANFPVQALSLIGKHCPLIEKVNIFCQTVNSRPSSRSHITEWFQGCPPFRHLQQIMLGSQPIHNVCLHFILRLMREAPLKHLTLMISNNDPKFRAMVLRSLPLLDEIDAEFSLDTPELRSRTMANGTKFWFFKSEDATVEDDHAHDYMKFNEERDDNGKTGRECFYEKLYESLTDAEKSRIDALENEENYAVEE